MDLLLSQGDSWQATLRFGHGPIFDVADLEGSTLTTAGEHCLRPGTFVHVGVADRWQQVHHICAQITAVPEANQATVAAICGNLPDSATCGYITAAVDLRGFELLGAIATRNPRSVSPPTLSGCVGVGDNRVLITGAADVVQGDLICMDAAGIVDAKVTGVYVAYVESEGGMTNSAVKGGGCSGCGSLSSASGNTGNAGSGDSVPVITSTILILDKVASSSVACDAPARIVRKGAKLADMAFSPLCDRRCGLVSATVANDALNALAPADGCDGTQYLGCYQTVLTQGCYAPRASYPRNSYINWAKTIAQGNAFLKTGFVSPFF